MRKVIVIVCIVSYASSSSRDRAAVYVSKDQETYVVETKISTEFVQVDCIVLLVTDVLDVHTTPSHVLMILNVYQRMISGLQWPTGWG